MAPSYWIALAVVLMDQLSKAWALEHLTGVGIRPLVPGLLQQRLVFNSGAAFSMLRQRESAGPRQPWRRRRLGGLDSNQWSNGALASPGLGFLLGGAIGNGIDRWRLGRVVDFLEFVPITFPIFNLADVAINLALLCLALSLLPGWRRR